MNKKRTTFYKMSVNIEDEKKMQSILLATE